MDSTAKLQQIISFINEVMGYVPSTEPKDINIIFGTDPGELEEQIYEPVNKEIKIYKRIGSVALIRKRKTSTLGSAENAIFSLLLQCDRETSKFFIETINMLDLTNNLIEYLFFEHGLLLLNRINNIETIKKEIKNYNVENVLFLSEKSTKSLSKFLVNKFDRKINIGWIEHLSLRNFLYINDEAIKNGDSCVLHPMKGFDELTIPELSAFSVLEYIL